jgi:hypothetical protein
LASDSERLDVASAFAELERLVRHLGDELASFRRRALQAEAKLKELETPGDPSRANPARLAELERENADLNLRLEKARDRTRQMLDRVRFLRQQHDSILR